MTDVEQRREIDMAVARLAAINAQIAELQQQGQALKSFVRLALGPGTHPAGNMRVSIIPRNVFDASIAATVIPDDMLPFVTVTRQTIDAKLARDVLPEDTYAACCRATEPAVRIM